MALTVVLAAAAPGPRAARAQAPAPAPPVRPSAPAQAPATTGPLPPSPSPVGDLTTRYRFLERYTTSEPDRARPGELSQYRVAERMVIRLVEERPQGAPRRENKLVQVIYAERPAAINSSGAVTDAVRRYEALRVDPALEARPSAGKPLEGLTVWYKTRPGTNPLVISLTPNRSLSELEYNVSRGVFFLPNLSSVLPPLATRVGDTWRVPRAAAAALLGDRPARGEPLVGTLQNVTKAASGPGRVALIGVTGRAAVSEGDTAINAQIVFSFTPPAEGGGAGGGAVEAVGAITEVRMARSSVSASSAAGGRLRSTLTRELTLQRQFATPGEPIALPTPPPVATESNSWLTYDDPKGRFHFRHPQELLLDMNLPAGDVVVLRDLLPNGLPDRVFMLTFYPKTGNPEADRNNCDPDYHVKQLKEEWAKNRQDVIPGEGKWLPKEEWLPHKMEVYLFPAALKMEAPSGSGPSRAFLDFYVIRTTQNDSLVVEATTIQDPPDPFRKEVQNILKTFRFGPSTANTRPGG